MQHKKINALTKQKIPTALLILYIDNPFKNVITPNIGIAIELVILISIILNKPMIHIKIATLDNNNLITINTRS